MFGGFFEGHLRSHGIRPRPPNEEDPDAEGAKDQKKKKGSRSRSREREEQDSDRSPTSSSLGEELIGSSELFEAERRALQIWKRILGALSLCRAECCRT